MPIMVRADGVAKRVAYKVLGVPENMKEKRATKKQSRIKRTLMTQELSVFKG